MLSIHTITLAVLGGLLPALLWLLFWLREDSKYPEPRKLVARAFLAGIISVIIVLPFQKIAAGFFDSGSALLLFAWATVEESFKLGAVYFAVFHRKELDEPIDAVVYLITAALGFVALENTLFLLWPIQNGEFIDTIVLGNMRFIGPSLIHIISSATIGIFFAFAFYKTKKSRNFWTFIGLLCAIALHTTFNFFIINSTSGNTFVVFAVLWLMVAALMLFFEKIKSLAH